MRVVRVLRLRRDADKVAVGTRLVWPVRRLGRGVGDVVKLRGRLQIRNAVDRRVVHRARDVDKPLERDIFGVGVAVGVEGKCQPAATVTRRTRHPRPYRFQFVRSDFWLGHELCKESLHRDLRDVWTGIVDDGRPLVVEREPLRYKLVNAFGVGFYSALSFAASLHAWGVAEGMGGCEGKEAGRGKKRGNNVQAS